MSFINCIRTIVFQFGNVSINSNLCIRHIHITQILPLIIAGVPIFNVNETGSQPPHTHTNSTNTSIYELIIYLYLYIEILCRKQCCALAIPRKETINRFFVSSIGQWNSTYPFVCHWMVAFSAPHSKKNDGFSFLSTNQKKKHKNNRNINTREKKNVLQFCSNINVCPQFPFQWCTYRGQNRELIYMCINQLPCAHRKKAHMFINDFVWDQSSIGPTTTATTWKRIKANVQLVDCGMSVCMYQLIPWQAHARSHSLGEKIIRAARTTRHQPTIFTHECVCVSVSVFAHINVCLIRLSAVLPP